MIVIGNFDGVHPGHRQCLRAAKAMAPGAPLIVLTFWPHPVAVLNPAKGPMLLTSLDERVALLREAGADEVLVIEFTREFASWSPSDFVERTLVPLHPRLVVVGENFRFGHRAAGTVDSLRDLAGGRFDVRALSLVRFGDEETSSSRIRAALVEGDVRHAAEHLGRPFRFCGEVVHGDERGRDLGFPTANLPVPELQACPADGIYAGWVTRLDGRDEFDYPLPTGEPFPRWPAAISVGSNPTFDGDSRRVESYVLDRDDLELYGARIAVDFVERIRGQIKFSGVGGLIEQMRDDVAKVRQVLG